MIWVMRLCSSLGRCSCSTLLLMSKGFVVWIPFGEDWLTILLVLYAQPGDSSGAWIQTAMPRDMGPSGGMQTSSYYNLASQGQHSGYTHSQQPTHGHAHPNSGYTNLYHPSQAAPAVSHQMLQQPQGTGGGSGNTQAGGYQQQPQRTQQTWNNSNY